LLNQSLQCFLLLQSKVNQHIMFSLNYFFQSLFSYNV
jgi:hypothetical protein